jgi:hypothetical protein
MQWGGIFIFTLEGLYESRAGVTRNFGFRLNICSSREGDHNFDTQQTIKPFEAEARLNNI